MKKLTVLIVLLVAAFCLAACTASAPATEEAAPAKEAAPAEEAAPASEEATPAEAADEEIVIGYVVQRMADEYFNNQVQGMEDAVAELGEGKISFEVADANNDAQTCVDNALNMIGRGVDALFISAPDPSACAPVVEAANTAGVPVIACDMFIDGAYFLAHDDYAAGVMAGEFAIEYYEAHFSGVTPVVALIEHKAAADPCQKRIDGFVATFGEKYPDATFLPQYDAEGLLENGTNIMNDIITANPDVNVVFSINDNMALGCVSAIEAREMSDKIMVIGQGGCGITTFEKIQEPESPFVATIGYEPYQMGYDGVAKMAMPLLNGETIDERFDGVLKVIDKDNVKDWIG